MRCRRNIIITKERTNLSFRPISAKNLFWVGTCPPARIINWASWTSWEAWSRFLRSRTWNCSKAIPAARKLSHTDWAKPSVRSQLSGSEQINRHLQPSGTHAFRRSRNPLVGFSWPVLGMTVLLVKKHFIGFRLSLLRYF